MNAYKEGWIWKIKIKACGLLTSAKIVRLISIYWNFLMPKAMGGSDPLSREQEGKGRGQWISLVWKPHPGSGCHPGALAPWCLFLFAWIQWLQGPSGRCGKKTIKGGQLYQYMNLKKLCKWTYLQNRKKLTDIENKLMVTKGEQREEYVRSLGLKYTCCYI